MRRTLVLPLLLPLVASGCLQAAPASPWDAWGGDCLARPADAPPYSGRDLAALLEVDPPDAPAPLVERVLALRASEIRAWDGGAFDRIEGAVWLSPGRGVGASDRWGVHVNATVGDAWETYSWSADVVGGEIRGWTGSGAGGRALPAERVAWAREVLAADPEGRDALARAPEPVGASWSRDCGVNLAYAGDPAPARDGIDEPSFSVRVYPEQGRVGEFWRSPGWDALGAQDGKPQRG